MANQAFSRAAGAPLVSGNAVRVLRDAAENYPVWEEAIRRARHTVHLEMYIVHRDAVGRRFVDLLAAKAREMKIDQRPEIQADIDRRISGMKAYMEYQLAMTEIGILNGALIKELGIDSSADSVTDEEVAEFFDKNIRGKPGAPESADQIPAANLQNIKQQIAQSRLEKEMLKLIEGWTNEMTVVVNTNLVENVPLPEVKGPAPQGLNRLPGPVMR